MRELLPVTERGRAKCLAQSPLNGAVMYIVLILWMLLTLAGVTARSLLQLIG